MSKPWFIREIWALPFPTLLPREEFVRKYMPQYKEGYSSPTGIRSYFNQKTKRMVIPRSTKGSHQAQVTKRNNRIDKEYELYKKCWETEKEMHH